MYLAVRLRPAEGRTERREDSPFSGERPTERLRGERPTERLERREAAVKATANRVRRRDLGRGKERERERGLGRKKL